VVVAASKNQQRHGGKLPNNDVVTTAMTQWQWRSDSATQAAMSANLAAGRNGSGGSNYSEAATTIVGTRCDGSNMVDVAAEHKHRDGK